MSTFSQIVSNLAALGFDNESGASIELKIAEAIGIPIDNTIIEIGNSETRITELISTKNYGKADYYETTARAFQLGDDLIIDPVTLDYKYAVIDPDKQIVKQAAFQNIVSGNSATLFLKIAKVDSFTGDLVPLNTPELDAFINYFVIYEVPGLPISIISAIGNILNFNASATYYATYDLPALQANLSNALTAFRQTFAFNGDFFAGDLTGYIKANVPGIRDFYIYNTTLDGVPFGGSKSLTSGYFNYVAGILNNIGYQAI